MYSLLGIEMPFEEFDRLICEQNKGKKLEVVDGEVVAVEYEITQEDILNNLRFRREEECFRIINRGQFWYDSLSVKQIEELKLWYNAWLDVTETKQIPEKPEWLK